MRFIGKKEIKFVKLLLISPYFDQIIHVLYLASLGFLFYEFMNFPNIFTNFEIDQQLRVNFQENQFRKIQKIEEFKNYINNTVYKLYDLSRFPMFIPTGGIRLKKYSITQDCYNITEECNQVNLIKFN